MILLVYFSPYIFFGADTRILVHDNLNSNFVWYTNLASTEMLTADAEELIPRAFHGIPRGLYPNGFYLVPWMFKCFGPYWGYVANFILIHSLAFLGMFAFLKRFVFHPGKEEEIVLISLSFALLPFLPASGLTVAGIPWLAWALGNFMTGKADFRSWIVVILLPFYSSLFFGNLFSGMAALGFGLFYGFLKRKMYLNYFFAVLLFLLISTGMEHQILRLLFFSNDRFSRMAIPEGNLNAAGVAGVAFLHFLKGHYHFHSYHFPFLMLLVVGGFVVADKISQRWLMCLIFALGLLSLTFAWPGFKDYKTMMPEVFNSLQPRFYVLSPFLWMIAAAIGVRSLENRKPGSARLFRFILLLGIAWSILPFARTDLYGNDLAENGFYRTFFDKSNPDFKTVGDYFRAEDFKTIKKVVPPGDYYVACLGLDPEVAQYHGFNTLGGYYSLVPEKSASTFNRIHKSELDLAGKGQPNRRFNLFSKEFLDGRDTIKSLNWDFVLLDSLQCSFVFSMSPIVLNHLERITPDPIKPIVYRLKNRE